MELDSINQSTVTPIGDQLFIRRDRDDKTTPGGLELPEGAIYFKMIGTVVAVGPGAYCVPYRDGDPVRVPMQVKVGDKVIVPGNMRHVSLDPANPKDVIFICREPELLGIIKDGHEPVRLQE